MVEQGVVTSASDAFRRHLFDDGPVAVAHRELALAEALALGREAGARMALAHPHQLGDGAIRILQRHRADGLDGIEVHYAPYDAVMRRRWSDVAASLRLVATAGSDHHNAEDPPHGVDLDPDLSKRLLEWLGLG